MWQRTDAVPFVATAPRSVVVASYNVHRSRGGDGKCAPERVVQVMRELDADIVALQEVDSHLPEHGLDQLAYFGRAMRAVAVGGPTLRSHRGRYGNAVLSRWPVTAVRHVDLSVGAYEPRGALIVTVDVGTPLHVVSTHFGLRRHERARQAAKLLAALDDLQPLVMLGDLNEWLPRSAFWRGFHLHYGRNASGATFPARLPFLHLDRIFARPRGSLSDVQVLRTPLSRSASDHLPVRAVLTLQPALRPMANDSK